MPKVNFTIKGVDQLEKTLDTLLKSLSAEKVEILKSAANKGKLYVKSKAPKGPTGRLIKSVYANTYPETTGYPAHAFFGIRQGKGKAPHTHLVELGHGGPQPAPPHPFFWKAVDEIKPVVQKDIEDGLKKTIEKAV